MKDVQSGGVVRIPTGHGRSRYSLQLDKWGTSIILCAKVEVNNWPNIKLWKRKFKRMRVKT